MKLFYAAVCIVISFCTYSQEYIEYNGEKINAIDADNRPTGLWKLNDIKDSHQISVIAEYRNGERVAETRYYTDSNLFATCNTDGTVQLIYNKAVIDAQWYRDASGRTSLVDKNGNELGSDIMKYFFANSTI